MTGERHRIECAFVAGCDGARGVSRTHVVPERGSVARYDYKVGWLALLAGDSAHLIPPIAAKGLNLAVHDALLLADALVAYFGTDDDSGLRGCSAACLARAWEYEEFSRWFAELLHGPSSGDPFRTGSADARLRRILGSPSAAAAFADSYIGKYTVA